MFTLDIEPPLDFMKRHANALEQWLTYSANCAEEATQTVIPHPKKRLLASARQDRDTTVTYSPQPESPASSLINPIIQVLARTTAVVFPGLLVGVILWQVSNSSQAGNTIANLSTTLQLLTAKVTSIETLVSTDIKAVKDDIKEIQRQNQELNMRITALEAAGQHK